MGRPGNEYLDFLGGYGALNLGHSLTVVMKPCEVFSAKHLQASLNPCSSCE